MPAEVISCPNCGASDIPLRYSQDFVPCPYCGTTIRVTDRRPNTTQAYQERIERERGERGPKQEGGEQQALRDMANLRNKAKRGGIWAATLLTAVVFSVCALSLLTAWLKQGSVGVTKTMVGAGVFGLLSVAAWVVERRMYRCFKRTRGIF